MADITTIWAGLLTEEDREVIALGGYGKPRGCGRRPALLMIDPQWNYVGENAPAAESLRVFPSSVGRRAWEAVPATCRLLDSARAAGIPVIYTRMVQKDLRFDPFQDKADRKRDSYLEGHRGVEFIPELAPRPGELVIDKRFASVFWGTPVLSYLVRLGVDTLLFAGGTTSGCVRSAVVDAVTNSFRAVVVADCCFDRISVSHRVALLDIWLKYGDVLWCEDAVNYLQGFRSDQ
ncbi:MAG: isochorismatase family protein [Firmicutes bacterium]|nr:isochorismatase family protein [Bacillota bacterium]